MTTPDFAGGPTIPVPALYATGQKVSAPVLRGTVSDAVALLTTPPVFQGTQTQVSGGQDFLSGTAALVIIDTELYDNWNGHLVTTANSNYYGMLAGWYLVQSQPAIIMSGGTINSTTITQALTGLSVAGGSVTPYGGPALPNAAGQYGQPQAAAKLMKMVNVGARLGAGNDYVQGLAFQNTGATQYMAQVAPNLATLTVRWVAAASGATGLPVPPLAAFPSPPSYVTSAFMNANVVNTVKFLIFPPIMEYYLAGTGQTLTSISSLPATGQTISLDTGTVDNEGGTYSSGTWTAPVSGVYYCYGQVAISCSTTSLSGAAGLTITSANYNGGATFTYWPGNWQASAAAVTNCFPVRRRLRLNAGDTVSLAGSQHDSGGTAKNLLGTGGTECRLITIWESV